MRNTLLVCALVLTCSCSQEVDPDDTENDDTDDTESTDTQDTDPGCTSNAYQSCWSGDVYWVDSCDVRGALADDCASDENCTVSGNSASCVPVPTRVTGFFQCDGTQSSFDWWVVMWAGSTPVGRVQSMSADVRQGSTGLGTWTIPYSAADSTSANDVWAGGVWEDELGIDCDDTANTHITFRTNDGASDVAEQVF